MNDALRRRMMHNLDAQLAESMKALDKLSDEDGKDEPWMRAVRALVDELRGKGASAWYDQLGIDPHGRFVVYGMSLWPVMRIELNNPAKLRAVIARMLSAAGVQPQQRTLDGRTYWLAGDREVSFVAAVLDREAVAAVLPTAALDAALPQVLGIRPPERSLATTATVPSSRVCRMPSASIRTMRARPKALSVSMRTWWPRNDRAGTPRSCRTSAVSALVTCSPVDARTSDSRSSGRGWASLARPSSRLVSPAMAETTTAT